jgi:hypothetical protein
MGFRYKIQVRIVESNESRVFEPENVRPYAG